MTKISFKKETKKLCLLLVTTLTIMSCGCSKKNTGSNGYVSTDGYTSGDVLEDASSKPGSSDTTTSKETSADASFDVIGEVSGYISDFFTDEAAEFSSSEVKGSMSVEASGGASETEASFSDPDGDIIINSDEYELPIAPAAGLLTCGEWNDNENYGFFTNLVTSSRFNFNTFNINPYHRIEVSVTDAANQPIRNAHITLNGRNSASATAFSEVFSAVTDINGTAYLFYNISSEDFTINPADITVRYNGEILTGTVTVLSDEHASLNTSEQQDISSQFTSDRTVDNAYVKFTADIPASDFSGAGLDIMFVFDTTGSMSDELIYLQTEFSDIASRVSQYNPRFSVNFYRDEGDDYVVKSSPFTYDYQEMAALLNKQTADGGGDYPEAVHSALNDAIFNHDWSEDATKILFIILDAPPHSNNSEVNEVLNSAITTAASMGIRIIPVASSGVDELTEGFLRTCAMLTGGTYTFLTNDSGIGGEHLEPTIGSYTVESLNDCIVRLINEYHVKNTDSSNNNNTDNNNYTDNNNSYDSSSADGSRSTDDSIKCPSDINPYFTATVVEIYENSVLVSPVEGEDILKSSDLIVVSTDVITTNKVPDMEIGDTIRIIFNGAIQESYPAQINTVFAIYSVNAEDGSIITE